MGYIFIPWKQIASRYWIGLKSLWTKKGISGEIHKNASQKTCGRVKSVLSCMTVTKDSNRKYDNSFLLFSFYTSLTRQL